MTPVISIVLCTADRPENLRRTLDSIGRARVPADMPVELLVLENGINGTRSDSVVESTHLNNMTVRHFCMPGRGKSFAYNAGLAHAGGDIFLSTDDDVEVPADWIESMCRPIFDGSADAVAGGVRIAQSLLRPWMKPVHRSWLASTEFIDPQSPKEMVGCNMAFSRQVLQKVPAFDPEMGPGGNGPGQCEDALFSMQVLQAGYRVSPHLDVAVEHHFDPSRLSRAGFIAAAARRGRSEAYWKYHWEHLDFGTVSHTVKLLIKRNLRLRLERMRRRQDCRQDEGIAEWEMGLVMEVNFLRQWLKEIRRPRNYDRHGLNKIRGVLPDQRPARIEPVQVLSEAKTFQPSTTARSA